MRPVSYATSSASRFTPANDVTGQSVLTGSLLGATNSARAVENLSAAKVAVANPDIPPPVLIPPSFKPLLRDFLNQADLDQQWEAFKTHLKTQPLSEKEAVAFVRSGILQTDAGEAVADLIEGAMLRSVRPKGSLTTARLKEIVKVICHLPPKKWLAALGENLGFVDGKTDQGLKGVLHAQMEHLRTVRDEKIANDELLSDPYWDRLNVLAKEGRSYIRSSDGELDAALRILEDAKDLRPTPEAAHAELEAFIGLLEQGQVARVRWPDHFLERVNELCDEIKPNDDARAGRREVLTATRWLAWMFGCTDLPPASTDAPGTAPTNDDVPPLLATLQAFERSGSFYNHVTNNGPRIPQSFAGKLLWACNALDTFGLLKMDRSHIVSGPGPAPTKEAWKNGASDLPLSPLEPEAIPMDPLAMLEQFSAQADEILNLIASKLVPWNSAYADDLEQLQGLIFDVENSIYQQTTAPLSDSPLVFSDIGEQMTSLLVRIRGDLIAAGVAVLGRAGDLVEQNPGKAAGVFAFYMAATDFFTNWFLPEPQPVVDPLQGVFPSPDADPDEASVIHEYMIEEVMGLFEELPDVEDEIKQMISESDYPDPADDPQLTENIEALLQQPVPGLQNVTYQEYLHELYPLAVLEASEEFEDSLSGTTSQAAETASTNLFTAEASAGVRVRRSADDSLVQAPLSAINYKGLMIEAGQRALDAEISIQPGEEIVPGFTISQAAKMFCEDFVELQTVLDPALFILSSTERLIAESDLQAGLKSNVTYETPFRVEYYLDRPRSKYVDELPNKIKRYETFTLAELLMGQHETKAKTSEDVTILWPPGYTNGFKNAVEKNNLWGDYKERLQKVDTQSKFYDLWKADVEFKLQHLVGDFLQGVGISNQARGVGEKFLRGDIKIRPVGINQGKYSDSTPVSNAVFLTTANQGRDAREGLFVFMGGNETVIECPVELFEKNGKSIEEFPELRNELSNRIPLKVLLSRDDDDFKYSQGRFVESWNPIEMFKNYKWPYTPIIFGRRDGPTNYGEHHDAYKNLFEEAIDKAKSDMDTLTSTGSERIGDKLMGIFTDSLKYGAIILALPGAPTAALAFLMGASASGSQYLRGKIIDDPLEADRHKSNAIIGFVGQIAGPYIGRVLGKGFSKVVDSRIAGKVFERFKHSGVFPASIAKHFPKYGHASSPLLANANKIEKWIAPRVRNPLIIQDKVNRKFTNNVVVGRLKSLGKGPHVAQRLMERSRVLYFNGPKEGYVYRGFAMHGDMRPPQDIFANGLKSGGAKASGYYDSNGTGAFHDGGKQGGWTYLIDGRGVGGKDVLRNMNWKTSSGSRLGSNPYEIRYFKDTPGSKILGAYDRTGKFTPNPNALNRAIKKSDPKQFVDAVPFPLKNAVQNKNSTRTPIKFPS